MPKTRADLIALLGSLGIETRTVEHPPLHTVEESRALRGDIPGAHCKNLFLKNRKGAFFLVVCREDAAVDLKTLAKLLGADRLSFGSPERLEEVLGVTPGSVTPFAAINDAEARVQVVLDAEMMTEPLLNYHPLTNEATTAIASDDLLRFLDATGHAPMILRLPLRVDAAS